MRGLSSKPSFKYAFLGVGVSQKSQTAISAKSYFLGGFWVLEGPEEPLPRRGLCVSFVGFTTGIIPVVSFTVALRCAFNASIWARLETPDSASAVCDLKARLMAAAHSGNSKTVRAPPATRSDAVELSSSPELLAILVTATIIGCRRIQR